MGYSIELESKPFPTKVPTPMNFNKEQFEIENEVFDLLSKKQLVFQIMNQDNLFQTFLLLKRRTVNTDLSLTSKN